MTNIKFLKFTRYSEWWEYKMVPLLAIAYITTLSIDVPFIVAVPRIALLLVALIVGAVYVSVINDLTDISEDAIAGKRNSMANFSPVFRIVILIFCVLLGGLFIFLMYPDIQSMIYQTLSYLVFTLYSVKPIRLKTKGFWGVLCDASGAHLFPSLLISTNLLFHFRSSTNLYLIVAIGIWALMYGLRGILWHQFFDRENDIKSGTNTFAVNIEPAKFKVFEKLIFTMEAIALAAVLYQVFNFNILLGIFFYLILVLARRFALGYSIFFILTPRNKNYQLLMNDYYFVFMPLSILFTIALNNQYGWIAILVHMILFPKHLYIVCKDLMLVVKKMLFMIQKI